MLYSARFARDRSLSSLSAKLHIHCIAVGGTGMAPLAALLAADGHRVTGSDAPLYPPMSTLLAAAGVAPFVGYDPAHLEPRPDLVIVGNAVPRGNAEAVECERLGLPRLSMPEALARFFLADRRPLVVAGTHGKTTTTALAAWTLTHAGSDPGYLVGGVPVDLGASFHRGGGPRFVVEGDEYNAAYFDRGAKFLHYRPETAIVTSVEHDHVDLYPDAASFRDAFRRFVALVPPGGRLVACGDSDEVREVARAARCEVVFYGEREDNAVRFAAPPAADERGMRFEVCEPDGGRHAVRLGVWGVHNATNALAVWAAVRGDGVPPTVVADAFSRFRGVKRRQEVVGDAAGVVVVDDFAHHPTAVGKTLAALRQRFAGRRLLVAFEPRSLTAGRAFFLAGYREAFRLADAVWLAPLYHRDRLAPQDRLDLDALAADLSAAGTPTRACASLDEVETGLLAAASPGDAVVTMSSGSFGGLAQRLVAGFAAR
jgi:UDP-N-acetylmuramate: L-alanyl-gamma-D-glutamyl-meso-diaminopimelate ligase